ncbi:12030_t:CDS:1, partial [Acaulospora colombiana]
GINPLDLEMGVKYYLCDADCHSTVNNYPSRRSSKSENVNSNHQMNSSISNLRDTNTESDKGSGNLLTGSPQ